MSYAIKGPTAVSISADGNNLDAFNRLRVSSPDSLFDSAFQYDLQPLVYQAVTAVNGTVAHAPTSSGATLACTDDAGSTALLQSKQYLRYIPGKSQLIIMTGVFGTATANVRKRIGYFDNNNGVYLEQNGTTDLAVVVRSDTTDSVVNNRIVQASWNLDTLDGTRSTANPSGLTLNAALSQIVVIDLQWLGMGRVRVGFDIDGDIVYVHQFKHANVLSVPYMRTANLPIRWSIEGLATTAGSMLAGCASVSSEGGARQFFSYTFGYNRASLSAGSGSQTYAFSIRPKSTFNSIVNRSLIRPILFNCAVTGVNPVLVEIYYGTTIGGAPSWGDLNATYSGLQVDTAGTPSGGFLVEDFTVASAGVAKGADSKDFFSRYPLVMDYAGTGYNHFTVYVTGLGGASACIPGLNWEEIR